MPNLKLNSTTMLSIKTICKSFLITSLISISLCQLYTQDQRIGINTIDPTATLDVFDNSSSTELKVRNTSLSRIIIDGASPSLDLHLSGIRKAFIGWSNNTMKMYSSPSVPPFDFNYPTLSLTEERKVGINMGLTGNPIEALDVNGRIKVGNSTDSAVEAGTIRWNESTGDFEGYNGTEWLSLTPQRSKDWINENVLTSQSSHLSPSGNSLDDHLLGFSVCVSDDFAFAGAINDDIDSIDQGSVEVYRRVGGQWLQHAKLSSSQPRIDAGFGGAIDRDGDYLVVGARNDHGPQPNCGAVYVFHYNGTNWTEQAKLTASDATTDDLFGASLSIEGDRIVVGASAEDGNRGAIYVFNRNGTSWTQVAKLAPNDSDFVRFGWSVDIDGNYIVAGSPSHGVNSVGAAYIFFFNGSAWGQQAKLIHSDPSIFEYFGTSVAIDGDYVVVGSPEATTSVGRSGMAYVFQRSGTTWPQQFQLRPSTFEVSAEFGISVDIHGENIVIGSYKSNNNGIEAGIAFVFTRFGNVWNQQVKLHALNGQDRSSFGYSVSISSNHILVGAPEFDNLFNNNVGRAYFFNR